MRTEKLDEKRNNFKNLLFKLAVSQMTLSSNKDKSEVYRELEDIYSSYDDSEDFRHFYSDIFAVLSMIDKDSSLGNMEILSQNMDIIRQGYRSMNTDSDGNQINIEKQINKLYDHVNLEIARMNYFKETEMRTDDKLQNVSETLGNITDNVQQMKNAVSMADEMQKQYITILGIFASIVLAFVGGITFSSSVLQNMENVSIYRLLVIVVILAFVLVNVIWLLIKFIIQVNDGDTKVFNIKAFNIICGISIIVIFIAWLLNAQSISEFVSQYLPWCK